MSVTDIPILATALSIIICWSLFAMLCSFVHEFVVRTKSERGRFFRKKLMQQLRDRPNDVNWGYLMYTHGHMDLLTQDSNSPAADVSSKVLAQTFIRVVSNSAIVARHMTDRSHLESVNDRDGSEWVLLAMKTATSELKNSDVIQMLQICLQQAIIKADRSVGAPDSRNSSMHSGIVLDELENQIASWFEQLGAQCSTWYASLSLKRLFGLGLLFAIILNIDSVQIFDFFLREPAARSAVMSYYEERQEKLDDLQDSMSRSSDSLSVAPDLLKEVAAEAELLKESSKLPVGFKSWCQDPLFSNGQAKGQSSPAWFWLLIVKLIGLVITGLAASIGAPFWFDVLRKVYSKKI